MKHIFVNSHPLAEIPHGTLHIDYHMGILRGLRYCSVNTGPNYKKYIFGANIVKVEDYYEIDLTSFPSYEGRDMAAYIIHTLPSDRGGKKICVSTGKEPRDEKSAKDLFMNWCDLNAVYIITGKTPNEQIEENYRNRNNL